MRNKRLLLCLIFLLSACAEQPKKSAVLIPVEERNAPPQAEKYESDNVQDKSANSEAKQTQAVIVAFVDQAKQFVAQGDTAKAAATIERGLRIEPKNATLWHHLALIRLQQQQWQQAIALARKSNALAAYNASLKSANWGIIADAYDRLGNKQKAREARKKQTDQG